VAVRIDKRNTDPAGDQCRSVVERKPQRVLLEIAGSGYFTMMSS